MKRKKDLKNYKFSLRTELVIVMLLTVLIAVSITLGVIVHYSEKAIETNTSNNIRGILRQSSENIDMKIKDIDSAISTYVSTPQVYSMLKNPNLKWDNSSPIDFYRIFSDIQFLYSEIESIHLISMSGRIYGFSPSMITRSLYDLRWAAESGDGRVVWLTPEENSPGVTYVKMYYDEGFKPIGYAVVNVRRSFLKNMLNWKKISNNGTTYVVSKTGHILSAAGEDNSVVRAVLDKALQTGVDVQKVQGEKYYTYRYTSETNKWEYLSIIPASELLQDIKTVHLAAIITAVLTSTVFALIIIAFAMRVTKPIQKITKAMQKYNLGQTIVPVEITSADEIGFLTSTFNAMMLRIANLVETVYKNELLMNEQKFKILQAQINPHFLYNTFDMISWTARENNVPQIAQILKALSNVMRYTINAQSDQTLLSEEIKNVKDYLAIQSFRLGNRLKYSIKLPDDLTSQEIVKLVLQPIVENVFVHGFEKRQQDCRLEIDVFRKDHTVYIIIANNGQPINEDTARNAITQVKEEGIYSGGAGLSNVDRRIKIRYGEKFGIAQIGVQDGWSKITLAIPYQKKGGAE